MKDEEVKKYALDKTAFSKMSFEEANNHYGYWKNKSMKERINAAFYLIYQMYGVNKHTPIDKTVFSKRKHKHG